MLDASNWQDNLHDGWPRVEPWRRVDDQTQADADQVHATNDQISADLDQLAADRDQAASDEALADGRVDAQTHGISRDLRLHNTRRRQQNAMVRQHSAHQRDITAVARDLATLDRDRQPTPLKIAKA